QVNIEKNGPEAEPYPSGLDELIEDADIIMMHFAPLHASLIKRAKHLKVILTCRGGVEQINIEAANDRNIPVINV
ncbi:3-phosphoglycerate dehydrogenase, partial [Erysipelatoclostridium ramosum]|nr:3-phosphoglycerate dehydrogenase [Thomasclavelia ramosa]